MATIRLLLDLALALTLLGLAWRILHGPELFQSIVLFITFGLVLALAWVRLAAPDIAITEAAIGAGLTGVLLLDTFRRIQPRLRKPDGAKPDSSQTRTGSTLFELLALAGVACLAALLLTGFYALPRTAAGLAGVVQEHMQDSGITHPVTAVLINFRGFDTMLEIGVLLLAMEGMLCVRGCPGLKNIAPPPSSVVVLEWLVRGLFPLMVLATGYLLVKGSSAPGGAFQAGVVLGAGLLLLWMAGRPSLTRLPRTAWRLLFGAGFGTFLAAGSIGLLQGRAFFEFHPASAKFIILFMETAAAISIASIMAGLFLSLQPLHKQEFCMPLIEQNLESKDLTS